MLELTNLKSTVELNEKQTEEISGGAIGAAGGFVAGIVDKAALDKAEGTGRLKGYRIWKGGLEGASTGASLAGVGVLIVSGNQNVARAAASLS